MLPLTCPAPTHTSYYTNPNFSAYTPSAAPRHANEARSQHSFSKVWIFGARFCSTRAAANNRRRGVGAHARLYRRVLFSLHDLAHVSSTPFLAAWGGNGHCLERCSCQLWPCYTREREKGRGWGWGRGGQHGPCPAPGLLHTLPCHVRPPAPPPLLGRLKQQRRTLAWPAKATAAHARTRRHEPALERILPTASVGCAPVPSQYLARLTIAGQQRERSKAVDPIPFASPHALRPPRGACVGVVKRTQAVKTRNLPTR